MYDSPIKAAHLQGMLRKNWCEGDNSYKVMS